MALVPFRGSLKRSNPYANPYAMVDIKRTGTIMRSGANATGYARNQVGYARSGGRGRRGNYRQKFNTYNTNMSPVYPRPEVKNIDYQAGSLAAPFSILADGTNMYVLNQIAPGSAGTQRIGRQVSTKSVYYQFVLNFGTGAVPNAIRHILFWDKAANGDPAPASAADVLSNSAMYIASPLSLANSKRFVILADDRFTLSPNGEQIKIVNGFRKINQLTEYNDTNNNPMTGALLLLLISDEVVTANQPTCYGIWRTRFIDC